MIHAADDGAVQRQSWIAIRYRESIANIACSVGLQFAVAIYVFAGIKGGIRSARAAAGIDEILIAEVAMLDCDRGGGIRISQHAAMISVIQDVAVLAGGFHELAVGSYRAEQPFF